MLKQSPALATALCYTRHNRWPAMHLGEGSSKVAAPYPSGYRSLEIDSQGVPHVAQQP